MKDFFNAFARLFRSQARPAVVRVPAPAITYHGERDGEVERRLKERWVQRFRVSPGIRRAYWVQATKPGELQPRALLAIVTRDAPDAALATSIEAMAATELPTAEQIEVLWLGTHEYAPIERVCPAFYYAA